jgi:hypothetical protein
MAARAEELEDEEQRRKEQGQCGGVAREQDKDPGSERLWNELLLATAQKQGGRGGAETGSEKVASRSRRGYGRNAERVTHDQKSARARGRARPVHPGPRRERATEREAREIFPATIVARDGLEVEVPFEPTGPAD